MTPRELDDDRMLSALGELQRSERAELGRWDARAQELAARDPERARALEDRLMAELFAAPPAAAARPMRPARRRARQLASAAALSLAAAASFLLWAREPRFDVTYTLVAPSPDAQSRSSAQPGTSAVYSLGRTLTFLFRPALRYEGALSVTCYASQEEKIVRLDPEVERDPAGGARVRLPADVLREALDEGSWQLRFYLAPPSAADVTAAEVRAAQCPPDTRCLTFDARFVQPEP